MLNAVESSDGFANLRALVKRYLDDGIPSDLLLEDLDEIRALVPEDVEDSVLDVMDNLTGWCAPHARLINPQKHSVGWTETNPHT